MTGYETTIKGGNESALKCDYCGMYDLASSIKNRSHICANNSKRTLQEIEEFEFKYVSSKDVRVREKALKERVKDFEYKLELQKITAYGNKITAISIIQAALNIKQRRIEGFHARINPIPTFLPGGIISDLALCAEQDREMIYNSLGVPEEMMKQKYIGLSNNIPEMLEKMNR